MNDSATAAQSTNAPLSENQYVKELFSIMQDNGRDTSGLSALLGHVSEMETFVKNAEEKISVMKDQLAEMKEIQNHPVKTALRKAIKSLEHTVSVMKDQIGKLKSQITDGCKSAVTAFKENGISALNNLAKFFRVKPLLSAINNNATRDIGVSKDAISRINEYAKQYHTAGRAIKNIGRMFTGKDPIDDVKQAGVIAKTLSAPYRANIAIQNGIKKAVGKAADAIDELDAAATVKQAERMRERKPSLLGNLAAKKEIVAQKKLEIPTPERAKTAGLEV
jgi:chromosome segregation ATPase